MIAGIPTRCSLPRSARRILIVAACSVFLAAEGAGQTRLSTHARFLAVTGEQVPSLPPGVVYANPLNLPYLDNSGAITFHAKIQDLTGSHGVHAGNNQVILHGTSATTFTVLARGSDPAPGLPGLSMIRSGDVQFHSSVGATQANEPYWVSALSGGGVTTANDAALFVGPPFSPTLVLREGEAVPGTAPGTRFAFDFFSAPGALPFYPGSGGHLSITGATTGGDSTPANDRVIVSGMPGALQLRVREGDAVLGGNVIEEIGDVRMIDTAGSLFYSARLSQTLGSPPATDATDQVLFQHIPGVGSVPLLREGDPAPGIPGATLTGHVYFHSYSAAHGLVFSYYLLFGGAPPSLVDRAIFLMDAQGITPILRGGTPSVVPGANYGSFDLISRNASGDLVIAIGISGPGVTGSTNAIVLHGPPTDLRLLLREGDPAPGLGGAVFGRNGTLLQLDWISINNRGQLYFYPYASGGTAPSDGRVVYFWDPLSGMHLYAKSGEPVVLPSGATHFVGAMDIRNFPDGQPGKIAAALRLSGSVEAHVIIDPPLSVASFCSGDITATDHTTGCPCGNFGAAGHGCANSVEPNGALLAATGLSARDDVALEASGMPATSSCIYLQGDALADDVFGDGVRCVGGSLIRLRARFNVGGASAFPDSTDTISLSTRGGVVPGSGDRRYYQVYYRNAAAAFCAAETFNVTNGLILDW